jgi:hypothetical protein
MKQFLIKTISFSGFALIVIFVILFSSNILISNNQFHKIDSSIKILFLGHSHPEEAINDSIIVSSRNFARGGEHNFYTFLKARKLIESNKNVKFVFLEFTNNQLSNNMIKWITDYDKTAVFFPNYTSAMNWEDHLFLFKKKQINYLKIQQNIFFNNINFLINRERNVLSRRDWGGFYANKRQKVAAILNSQLKSGSIKINDLNFELDDTNLIFIDKIKELCENKGVKLFLIRSPQHSKYKFYDNEAILQKIKETRYSDIPFLDFNNFPLNNSEFADLEHLNYKGATKFSLFFNKLITDGLLDSNDPEEMVNKSILNYK